MIRTSLILQHFFSFWSSPREGCPPAVKAEGEFRSIISNMVVGFCGHESRNVVLDAEEGGRGILQNLIINNKREDLDDFTFQSYLQGTCI